MVQLKDALRAAGSPVAKPTPRVALLAGAAGPLGSAVLEQALAVGGFTQVRVLVNSPVAAAMRGFAALTLEQMPRVSPQADTAFIVFDRERRANGREDAFLRPDPDALRPLARRLREAGARRLIVVLPHAPALLPHALKMGLATLDEQAIAALDFEQVVFVRSARTAGEAVPAASWPARLARAVLSQLHWMIPQQEQPVRAVQVAGFVARLARDLHGAPHARRVVAPEVLWQASQQGDLDESVRRWLHG